MIVTENCGTCRKEFLGESRNEFHFCSKKCELKALERFSKKLDRMESRVAVKNGIMGSP